MDARIEDTYQQDTYEIRKALLAPGAGEKLVCSVVEGLQRLKVSR